MAAEVTGITAYANLMIALSEIGGQIFEFLWHKSLD
jgi:hypothetical protein